MAVNWSLPFEEVIYPESDRIIDPKEYSKLHDLSVKNYRKFWEGIAKEIDWYEPWKKVLDDSNPPFYKWFAGGKLNACYLCVDRHANSWRKNKVALIWEGEPYADGGPVETRKLTFGDLYGEVNRVAYMLKNVYKLGRGDVIGIYLPMVTELPIIMLAAARIGVVFTVIFSGFGADAITERLNDSRAKLVITADGAWRAGKIIPLKGIMDKALAKATTVRDVLVVKRLDGKIGMTRKRDSWYHEILAKVPANARIEPERMRSEDPLYILYTSGTTGKPKGQVHDTGGYMTILHATMNWVFDIRPEDTYWCSADIGWVTGHSYIVFGPLMEGATGIMYEGSPIFPGPDRWASIIERYGVNVFYTSPTAIRGWMKFGDEHVKKHNTDSIRLMHSVGEPINPEAFRWFHGVVGKNKITFGSTWWMTETGGILISHLPGKALVPMKPGTNGLPIMGIDADILDEDGKSQKAGERGFLVIKNPWPGLSLTIHNNPERFKEVYFSKFPGCYYAGDYAVRDKDGYFWILGRSDEVIKVAGHRLGTYELESAIVQHSCVSEAAVVGVADEVKGEVPVAFIILKVGKKPSDSLRKEINSLIRENIGPIASLKDIYFVTRLPKTRSAKIMRRVIRAVVSGVPIGDITSLEDEASINEVKAAYLEFRGELSLKTAQQS